MYRLLFCSERSDAEKCMSHAWMVKSDSKRIGTGRLKSFRARRRWLVSD